MRTEPAPTSPVAPRAHCDGVDALRGAAVIAMVIGHTLDAVLAAEVRTSDWAVTYWRLRGVTAPLFLVVSGWALSAWAARSTLAGWALARAKLPRVALLLAAGYLLRLPVGADLERMVASTPELARILAFDALHCIAVSLLATVLLLAMVRGPVLRMVALVALAALVPVASAGVWRLSEGLPLLLRQAVSPGGGSPFPLLPWAGYFFAGAAVGVLPTAWRPPRRPAAWLLAAGSVAALAAVGLGLHGLPATSPTLFLFRVGEVLLVAGFVTALPLGWKVTIAPLGRLALGVYVTHLVLLYGWARWPGLAGRIGPVLPIEAALAVAAVVLGLSVAGTRAWQAVWRQRPVRHRNRRPLARGLTPATEDSAS